MKTKLDQRLLGIQVQHEHNMGPWAIVEDLGDEYVRVADVDHKGNISSRAFLAWVKKLSPYMLRPDRFSEPQEVPFSDVQMGKLGEIRKALADGTKMVISTHIVPE